MDSFRDDLRKAFPTPGNRLAMVSIILQSLFSGLYWGFTSFQASLLHSKFEASYGWLAVMIPISTLSYVTTLLYIGIYGHRHTHKSMYLFSSSLGILHSLLVIRGVLVHRYWTMAIGYFMGGISYAIIDIIPVIDAKRFSQRVTSPQIYNFLYISVSIADALSLALGRFLMVTSLLYGPPLPVAWEIPWGLEVITLSLCFLLVWFSEFPEATRPEERGKPVQSQTVKTLVRSLWETPIFRWFSFGYSLCAFSFGATTAWYPVIVEHLFTEEDPAFRTWIFLICSVPCVAISAIITTALIKRVNDRRHVVILVGNALVAASLCAFALFLVQRNIVVFAVLLSIFIAIHYFPHFILKTLPKSFDLNEDVATFGIAVLTIIYALFGNAVGVLAVGAFITTVDIQWSLGAIALSSALASIFFFIPLRTEKPRKDVVKIPVNFRRVL